MNIRPWFTVIALTALILGCSAGPTAIQTPHTPAAAASESSTAMRVEGVTPTLGPTGTPTFWPTGMPRPTRGLTAVPLPRPADEASCKRAGEPSSRGCDP
jgi:hypothetical protein